MEKNVADLAKHVLKKPLHECDADEIRQLIKDFPYFSPAYFLLLKKLDPGSEEYKSVYQTGILYYNDPLSFDRMINDDNYRQEAFIPLQEEKSIVIGKSEESSLVETNFQDENRNAVNEELQEESDGSFDNQETSENDSINLVAERHVNEDTDISPQETVTINAPEEQSNNSAIAEPIDEQLRPELNNTENTGKTIEGVEPLQESAANHEHELAEPVVDSEDRDREFTREDIPVKLNIDLNAPAEGDLSFEPYHTVDYFASQGIKISQVDTGKDKFGRQLKSFTEWLKTMKRLPQAEITAKVDENSESKVENLAAGSLQDREVVTEAMAEVWLKQGNKAKALEVYNKLSLLNPSKKAYFAAKIEEFNAHN